MASSFLANFAAREWKKKKNRWPVASACPEGGGPIASQQGCAHDCENLKEVCMRTHDQGDKDAMSPLTTLVALFCACRVQWNAKSEVGRKVGEQTPSELRAANIAQVPLQRSKRGLLSHSLKSISLLTMSQCMGSTYAHKQCAWQFERALTMRVAVLRRLNSSDHGV